MFKKTTTNSSGQLLHFSHASCSWNGCQLQTGQLANAAAQRLQEKLPISVIFMNNFKF